MKKLLLPVFTLFLLEAQAQCPVTVNGQTSGGSFSTCSGQCLVLNAGGATTYTWCASLGGANTSTVLACPSSATTYSLFGQTGGCLDTNVFTVNISPNPTLTVTGPGGIICAGTTTTLCVSGAQTYTWSPGTGLSSTTGACVSAAPSSTITYTICGTNFLGCYDCTSLSVVVGQPPTVTFTMSNSAPQVWDAVAVYSGGTGPFVYDWDWGDGSAHGNTAYPSHTYTTAGWYNVCATITDANGCVGNYCSLDSLYRSAANSMITLNVVNGSVGVQTNQHDLRTFYPNPASDQLTVNSQANSIEIYDLSGKLVLNRTLNGKTRMDISSLQEGVYMLSIKIAEKQVTQKLVIVR